MPRGSQCRTSRVAIQASRVSHMRTALMARPRPAPAAQLPAGASPFAAGPPAAGPRQPGLMARIATTGAGVGYTLGHTIIGGFSEGSNAEPASPDITYQEPQGTQMPQRQQTCFYEIKPFLECARNRVT
nr:coiled-coil-helix-coiled-coil-helix domain-containing protein 2-like [Symphalangus syndactylus]